MALNQTTRRAKHVNEKPALRDLALLAQYISRLPSLQKKVLAMYYFENMPLADIGTSLGLSKIKTCQILIETSAQLFLAYRRTS
jgi:DNA-directed RNA polymerase specialized sigma subunit